ncbi:hypothetical protein [Clostridium sp. D5]|nr:hypothetical protein [Clostridium sp. D5]
MRTFIRLGFKAVVTCVDGSVLDESFAGRKTSFRKIGLKSTSSF